MDTHGARHTPAGQPTQPGARPLPRFIAAPEPPCVHDLLVMSRGPDAPPDPANHACLNSFSSSSWIIAAGG
jgi:hypothetical protein